MIKHSIFKRLRSCQILLFFLATFSFSFAQTGPNDDFDGDGIINSIDLDDDNDGIPDAVESPTCFYSLRELKSQLYISSNLTFGNASNPFSNALDNNPESYAFVSSGSIANLDLFTFNFPLTKPMKLQNVTIQIGINNAFPGSSVQLQGWNGNSWVNLSNAQPMTVANTTYTFTNTLSTANAYNLFRIRGLAGTVTNGTRIQEVNFNFSEPFISSQQPKTTCLSDKDGDGLNNHFDLDSDGDGCYDKYEANVTGATLNGSYTDSLTVPQNTAGDVGANGLSNSVETSADSGTINYTSTYDAYAVSNLVKACSDTDGDGVRDIVDIDDDNDGVTDCAEGLSAAGARYQVSVTDNTGATTRTAKYIASNGTSVVNIGVTPGGTDDVWGTGTGLTNTNDMLNINMNMAAIPGVTIMNLQQQASGFVEYLFTDYNDNPSGTNEGNRFAFEYDESLFTATLSGGTVTGLNIGDIIYSGVTYATTTNQTAVNYNIKISSKTVIPALTSYTFRNTESGTGLNLESPGLALINVSCMDLDTDNDGIPNRLDLDSDGDGCPDAVEAGVSANPGAAAAMSPSGGAIYTGGIPSGTANAYVGNGTPSQYGSNGFFNDIETGENGIYNSTYTYTQYAMANNLNICADTDSDGISDLIDIDDDNDGVLDAVESPSCFYTAAEANVISKITSQFLSPDDNQSDGDIQLLHDGSTALIFNFNAYAATSNPTGSNLFTIEYPTAVKLATINVSDNISATANANAVIVGSNDGVNWSSALSPATLITTTPINFTVTASVPYKYYRIQTGSVPGALAVANTIGEITSTITSDYIASAHPKPTCGVDFDGDGIFNHLDNDSDNDGCSDAFEAGTADYASANGGTSSSGTLNNPSSTLSPNATVGTNVPADYGANGFYNVLETSGNGVYSGTYTYSDAINAGVANCSAACYKNAVTTGTLLSTNHGITSLQRAGANDDNWPMVRNGAWTVLESKTKGFVPNRLMAEQINNIPTPNLVEGMMVYNITEGCLYINTDGTPAGWKCFNTQACP